MNAASGIESFLLNAIINTYTGYISIDLMELIKSNDFKFIDSEVLNKLIT